MRYQAPYLANNNIGHTKDLKCLICATHGEAALQSNAHCKKLAAKVSKCIILSSREGLALGWAGGSAGPRTCHCQSWSGHPQAVMACMACRTRSKAEEEIKGVWKNAIKMQFNWPLPIWGEGGVV